jgi:hypothetical protein
MACSRISDLTLDNKSKKVNFKELLAPKMRKILLLGIVLAVFQQWCGINAIFQYGTNIFGELGFEVSGVMFWIVITGTMALLMTIFTVDRWWLPLWPATAPSWRRCYGCDPFGNLLQSQPWRRHVGFGDGPVDWQLDAFANLSIDARDAGFGELLPGLPRHLLPKFPLHLFHAPRDQGKVAGANRARAFGLNSKQIADLKLLSSVCRLVIK